MEKQFNVGDRVDHPIFGHGTITGEKGNDVFGVLFDIIGKDDVKMADALIEELQKKNR